MISSIKIVVPIFIFLFASFEVCIMELLPWAYSCIVGSLDNFI